MSRSVELKAELKAIHEPAERARLHREAHRTRHIFREARDARRSRVHLFMLTMLQRELERARHG
jgi:hypothetical protein